MSRPTSRIVQQRRTRSFVTSSLPPKSYEERLEEFKARRDGETPDPPPDQRDIRIQGFHKRGEWTTFSTLHHVQYDFVKERDVFIPIEGSEPTKKELQERWPWDVKTRKQRNAEISITISDDNGEEKEVIWKFKVGERVGRFDRQVAWREVLEKSKEPVSEDEKDRRYGLWFDKQDRLERANRRFAILGK